MIYGKGKKKEEKQQAPKTISNRFMDFIESKYMGINPIKRLISKFKLNQYCKKIMKQSPSLGVLWLFAEFIKIAERIYFFPNRQGNELYSSRSYNIGENGFVIIDEDHKITINIKLNSDYQRTIVEISRKGGTSSNTELVFVNNSWGDDIELYDEVLVDNIIGIINSHMVALIRYCWEAKGSYDDINKRFKPKQ